jgi:polyhydroxybutyrate depolymerase
MKLIRHIIPICLLIILLSIGCTNYGYSTFNHDGQTRKYIIYLPDNLPENAPLVFVLHGYGGNGFNMMKHIGMNRIADENGFAVCYPLGSLDFKDTTHWNARLEISETDDIGFLTELAKHLQYGYDLDEERTFSCGFSNGGFMSYTLAVETSDEFKAVASVAGTMSGFTWDNRNGSEPIPILHIHGINDKVVPIDGSMSTSGGWGGAPHMDTIIEFWTDLNNCSTMETEFLPPKTNAFYYLDGINGNEVWYYKIDNYGHNWPDSSDNTGTNASEIIWEFFSNY